MEGMGEVGGEGREEGEGVGGIQFLASGRHRLSYATDYCQPLCACLTELSDTTIALLRQRVY